MCSQNMGETCRRRSACSGEVSGSVAPSLRSRTWSKNRFGTRNRWEKNAKTLGKSIGRDGLYKKLEEKNESKDDVEIRWAISELVWKARIWMESEWRKVTLRYRTRRKASAWPTRRRLFPALDWLWQRCFSNMHQPRKGFLFMICPSSFHLKWLSLTEEILSSICRLRWFNPTCTVKKEKDKDDLKNEKGSGLEKKTQVTTFVYIYIYILYMQIYILVYSRKMCKFLRSLYAKAVSLHNYPTSNWILIRTPGTT